ncbi:MAG: TOBE domain-containing protein [Bacteroidetes bacterium]|nr:TOBE domain-containing protein [Bacteroidota bacterium]
MNSFNGHINDVKVSGSLSLVTIGITEDVTLKTIVVETPETAEYLQKGKAIKVLFKETEVIIGIDTNLKVSLQNRIAGTVTAIEKGSLLSKVTMQSEIGEIAAIISTNAVEKLELKENTSVVALVKLNEIMLSE